MDTAYTLLSPVKEEELRLSFGHIQNIDTVPDPDELFKSTTSSFKRLAIGNYFWFVADSVNWVVHSAGGMLEKMIPIKEKEFVKKSPEILFRNTHPEDIQQMFAFSNYWIQHFMGLPPERKSHVTATIYLRLLNTAHTYRWCMIQYADTIINNEGRILYGLTLVTDISHVKSDGRAMMSILDTYDDSCSQFICVDGKNLSSPDTALPKMSGREIEVLRYLAIGLSSKQIAAQLNIAVKTTDNHRQNMLHKTNTKTSGELVAYGIRMGFI